MYSGSPWDSIRCAPVDDTKTYIAFHSFWNEIDLKAPHMVVHYEHITSKSKVSRSIQSVMQFLDKVTPIDNYINAHQIIEMTKRAKDVIREPKYEQGTLVSKICGKESARMVHDATKKYSTQLGYSFNDETGFWTL